MASFFNRKKRSFFPEGSQNITMPLLFTNETNPTVKVCVEKIAYKIASLTPHLYVHSKSGIKLAVGEPLFHLLEHPAAEETPTLFWATLVRFLLYKGNAYIFISRDSQGNPVNFSLIDPNNVTVTRDERFRKVFTISGKTYTENEILHIPYNGPGYNGTVGKSPIEINRDLINLDNTLLSYVHNYFDNSVGSRLSIELGNSYPSRPADMDKLYASIMPVLNKFVIGARNAGKPMINLPDSKASIIEQPSNVQAELQGLMDMVEHQIAITCFNIPYEIIDSKAAKYNSLEAKENDFMSSCIQPIGDHICQSFQKLIAPSRTALYIGYDYKTLLKTDSAQTIDMLCKEFVNGAVTMNEFRKKIGMDSIGAAGDYHFIPANLMPLTEENIEAYMAKSKVELEKSQEHNPAGDDKA